MKQTIHFTKMHGAGNDYIYVNTLLYNIPDPSAASIAWSKPHFGIGSDGLILIGKATTPEADFSMRIFNNDGSEAMMCGNGTRCVAKFLHDKGMTDKNPIRLQTLSGIKVLQLHLDSDNVVEAVTVDMGEPILQQPEQFAANNGAALNHPVTVDGRTFHGTFVSMGNPHFVIFLEEDDVDAFPIDHYGSLLEKHPLFPQRCNIEFAEIEAAQLPSALKDYDYAVINSNYAIDAGLNPVKDSLGIEGSASAYVNIIAVKAGNENEPKIKALVAATESKKVVDYINENYDGGQRHPRREGYHP